MNRLIRFFLPVTLATVFLFTPIKIFANQQACNPVDSKPEPLQTRLGSFEITPDIVAVDGLLKFMVKTSSGVNDIAISLPNNVTMQDYSPNSLTDAVITAGHWQATSGTLAAGEYYVLAKASHFTKNQWQKVGYSVTNFQGVGSGYEHFFAYYDTLPIKISLGSRNEVPQTTKSVVRKVSIEAKPDVRVQISTDKGALGKNVSSFSGQSITLTANNEGKIEAYLYAEEGQKVTLSAVSPDSCQDSFVSQKFTVVKSDVGRQITGDYNWLWYLGGGVLIILLLLLFFWRRKKKKARQEQSIPPQQTDLNQPQPPQQPPSSHI